MKKGLSQKVVNDLGTAPSFLSYAVSSATGHWGGRVAAAIMSLSDRSSEPMSLVAAEDGYVQRAAMPPALAEQAMSNGPRCRRR